MTREEMMRIIKSRQVSAPVETVAVAKELGMLVYKVPDWPNSLSGMIRREADKTYAIYVNAEHPETRRRFTIAHEIAHFVLHRDKIGNGLTDDAMYRSGLSSKEETEANRLAADILMPWHLLKEDQSPGLSLPELAEKYRVSTAAMGIRIGVPAGAIV